MENQLPPIETFTKPPLVQVKKHTLLKIIIAVIGVIVLALILIPFIPNILGIFAKDITSVNDSDLQLQKIEVAENDNGYFDLLKLDNVIYYPKDKNQTINDMVNGKIWDEKFAEELISKNTEAFKYFKNAANKPRIQYPLTADPKNINPNLILPNLNTWRNVSMLDSVYAIYLAKHGKGKEAMEEALNTVKIGQKYQDSQIILIEYLVSLFLKKTGLQTIQQITGLSNLSSTDLKRYAEELKQYSNNEAGLVTSFKSEYASQSFILSVEGMSSIILSEPEYNSTSQKEYGKMSPTELIKKMKNSYYFEPNKTKQLFADNARASIVRAQESCGEITTAPIKRLVPTSSLKMIFEENLIGKIFHDIIAVSLDSVNVKKCEEKVLVDATRIMLATKAYKNDTKKYPSSLDVLIPSYLQSIPEDPFDKNPLKYSLSDKKIYSAHASSTFMFSF